MSEETNVAQNDEAESDSMVDAIAVICLVAIAVVSAIYWVSGQ